MWLGWLDALSLLGAIAPRPGPVHHIPEPIQHDDVIAVSSLCIVECRYRSFPDSSSNKKARALAYYGSTGLCPVFDLHRFDYYYCAPPACRAQL